MIYENLTMLYNDKFNTLRPGALVHTQGEKGKHPIVFLDLLEWPHDSNLTATLLLRVLNKLEKIPEVLYLQLDNCFRENKNKYILSLCSLLVEKGIFRKVREVH